MPKDPVFETIDRLAKCCWILRTVKRLGLPRPAWRVKDDEAQVKRDLLYLLKQMPGGNSNANRRKLYREINRMVDFLEQHQDGIKYTPRKKKK